MDEARRQELAKNLAASKDLATLREVVRLGESFLAAQLQSGLAADLRAMTLAAVLAAIVAGVVGGTATVVASTVSVGWHVLPLSIFCVAAMVALRAAIHAARPTSFAFAGNNPKFWEHDGGDDARLVDALAEQASLYAKGIEANVVILAENHRCLNHSLWWLLGGLVAAAGVEVVIILTQIGDHGFRAVLGGG